MKSASELRAEAAAYLLGWPDTAVIGAAATLLATNADSESLALLCRGLAEAEDPEVEEEILWVLSPLWKSGQLDLPLLLRDVHATFRGPEQRGAIEAAEWLGIELD